MGEIEAALGQHERVRQSVISYRRDSSGEKQLVAYVCANGDVGGGELRRYLAGKLPAYMIPGRFVMVTELPLTTNGKVDRERLAQLADERTTVSGTAVTESATERA